MGRTVATYTDLLGEEQGRMLAFRRALRREDQQVYDELWEWAKLHSQAGSYLASTSPLVPILFSMLIEATRKLREQAARIEGLEERLGRLEARAGEE